MRTIVLFTIMLAAPLAADLDEYCRQLTSDDFKVRQEAEKNIFDWAHEKEEAQRAEALYQRYLASEDPEEFHRLTKILLDVHFQLKKGSIPQKGPGFMGIQMSAGGQRRGIDGRLERVGEPRNGVLIQEVIVGAPAEEAGLQPGDLITEIDGESIAGDAPRLKLQEIVGGKPPGKAISLTVVRGDETLKIEVTLMNRKAVPQTQFFREETRIDFEKADQLLKEDYLRWLGEQRKAKREAKR